jgi:predicted NBD/HSP70 family sugar kinase
VNSADAPSQLLLRRLNAQRALDIIRDSDRPFRVAELAGWMAVTRPTADALVQDLQSLGLVAEHQPAPDGKVVRRGRPAKVFTFRHDARTVVGVDIGARKIVARGADLLGNTTRTQLVQLTNEPSRASIVAAVRRAIRSVASELPTAIAVGVPGVVSNDCSTVSFSTVLPQLVGANLGASLARSFGGPVVVENDANLAAVAERWRGRNDVNDLIVVLAGERLGAGIIVGGELARGFTGGAGEMGFMSFVGIDPGAPGVAAVLRDRDSFSSMSSAERVLTAAERGDKEAIARRDRALKPIVQGIATVATVLDPETVVIGGGVAAAGEALRGALARQIDALMPRAPKIELSQLGSDAVVIGAVRLALDLLEPSLLNGLGRDDTESSLAS